MATTRNARAEARTKTVTARVPVSYDNKAIAVGEAFEVREADLAQLLEVGAVAPSTETETDANA